LFDGTKADGFDPEDLDGLLGSLLGRSVDRPLDAARTWKRS
jgi:hypothetical protein